MGAETTFFKQWQAADKAPSTKSTQEKPVASFGHEMGATEVEKMIGDLPKMFRVVDDYFFPVLESFTDEKDPIAIEHFAVEQQAVKYAVRDELVRLGYSEPLVSVAMALLDIPAIILSQAKANRRRLKHPSIQFHQLPNEDREAVYMLSSWQQKIADYFIAFNEQKLTPHQSSEVYQRLYRQWLDYTNDAKAVVQKLMPDISDEEFHVATNFHAQKQGVWGTVGVALELFEQGYDLRWSDPETDVLRKIDMFATKPNDPTTYAISIKGWSGMEQHVAVREMQEIEYAPPQRRESLRKEWDGLTRGIGAYKRERSVLGAVAPMILVVATDKQDQQSGKMRISRTSVRQGR